MCTPTAHCILGGCLVIRYHQGCLLVVLFSCYYLHLSNTDDGSFCFIIINFDCCLLLDEPYSVLLALLWEMKIFASLVF